jgi:hypothetical protein
MELKPCPLCRGPLRQGDDAHVFECDTCDTTFAIGYKNGYPGDSHMNTRPVEDALNARVERLTDALETLVGTCTVLKDMVCGEKVRDAAIAKAYAALADGKSVPGAEGQGGGM